MGWSVFALGCVALLAAGAETNETPKPAVAIRVFDADTKKPLAGAIIRVFNGVRPTPYVKTDAAGAATVEYPPGDALTLDVHTGDHVQQRIELAKIKPGEKRPRSCDVALHRGDTVIGGRIVDEAGKPVAGATVRFGAYLAKARHPAPGVGELICDLDAVTDADGRYRFGSIAGVPWSTHIEIMHPDFNHSWGDRDNQPTVDQLMKRTAKATLRRGSELSGRVTDEAGKPIAGATVLLGDMGRDTDPRRTTDADGRYRFASVKSINQIIAVKAKGHAPRQQTLSGLKNPEIVDFKLGSGRTIAGRVTDAGRRWPSSLSRP
jgi:protocatechuate 3,4-dioxygenase beta subunit